MKKSLLKVVMGSIAVSMMGLAMPSFADKWTQAEVERFVDKCDINKDGMITRVEVMKMAAEKFDKMDTGKKGMLDEKKALAFLFELQMGDGAPSTYMTSKADLMKKIGMAFDKTDADKKGMLNMKQADAFLRELMKSGA